MSSVVRVAALVLGLPLALSRARTAKPPDRISDPMMVRALVLALAVLTAACGSTSTAVVTRSPSPGSTPVSTTSSGSPSATPPSRASASALPTASPSSGGYAVIEQPQSNGSYVVTIVSDTGNVVAHANAAGRNPAYPSVGPHVSSSNDLAYYLDGDSALHSLSPSGSTALIANLPTGNGTEAIFAVSPDDSRIAVALLTYGPLPSSPPPGPEQVTYKGMVLYVSDLNGANRTSLFSSSSVAEWPVGWHQSALVVAVSQPQMPGLGRDPYPYFAFGGYHLADMTGARVATLCPTTEGNADGMPTPDGVLCDRYGGSIYIAAYNNSETLFHQESSDDACFALEPGAQHVACLGDNALIAAGGSRVTLPGTPVGFIDVGHLLLMTTSGQGQFLLYDVATSSTRDVITAPAQPGTTAYASAGFVAARIPGAL